jgi:RNA polymerase sigma-70 factor (ECF subfamily)
VQPQERINEINQILKKHWIPLVAAVKRRLDPVLARRVDPEDIVNEAYMIAFRRWDDFEQNSQSLPVNAWLYLIVKSRLIDIWRHETRACRDFQRDQPMSENRGVLRLFDQTISSGGTTPGIEGELEKLRESERTIINLRYYKDLSYLEIAKKLHISENAAAVRCFRALRTLKALWLDRQSQDIKLWSYKTEGLSRTGVRSCIGN